MASTADPSMLNNPEPGAAGTRFDCETAALSEQQRSGSSKLSLPKRRAICCSIILALGATAGICWHSLDGGHDHGRSHGLSQAVAKAFAWNGQAHPVLNNKPFDHTDGIFMPSSGKAVASTHASKVHSAFRKRSASPDMSDGEIPDALSDEAVLKMKKEILDIRREETGEDSAATLEALEDYAWSLCHNSRLIEGEAAYKEALEIAREKLGPVHPFTLRCLKRFGSALVGARQRAQKEYQLTKSFHGQDDPDTLKAFALYQDIQVEIDRIMPYFRRPQREDYRKGIQ